MSSSLQLPFSTVIVYCTKYNILLEIINNKTTRDARHKIYYLPVYMHLSWGETKFP